MDKLPIPMLISLEVSSSGLNVKFKGRLTAVFDSRQVGIANKPIHVAYAGPSPPSAGDVSAGLTDANGNFEVNVTVIEKGNYMAASYFDGDIEFMDTWSGYKNFTVVGEVTPPSGFPILPILIVAAVPLGIVAYLILKK